MHQTSTGTKKTKKTKIPATTQCRFGASSGLFFLFFFGACAGLVTLTSQNIDRHQKKQKKQTTRCTKHRQAPKKKYPSNYSEVDP